MIIEKITIKSFGQLSNLTMDFSETVNVIEGANEAGKSTIAAFIKYMLYGFEPDGAGIPKDAVTERRKRISWDTGTHRCKRLQKNDQKPKLIQLYMNHTSREHPFFSTIDI